MNDLRRDAILLGGTVSRTQILCPGPGHSRDDRSLSLKASASSPIGYVCHSFAGDAPAECFAYIRERLGLPTYGVAPESLEFKAPVEDDDVADPSAYAKQIWSDATEIVGSLAEVYLRDARGLRLAHDIDWHRVLRFHKRLSFGKRHAPGLVALYRDVLTDQPKAIQRTFLTRDAKKIARWMLGPVKGCAIKIDPSNAVSANLSIGEGLETTLAGRVFGFCPAWAVGSAGAIADFPVIPGVETLKIFAENDGSGTNEDAIRQCRDRWTGAGRSVSAIRPPKDCGDLNDEWLDVPACRMRSAPRPSSLPSTIFGLVR